MMVVVDEEDLDSCCEIEEIFRLSVRDERLYGSSYTFEYSTEIINNEENGKFAYFRRNIDEPFVYTSTNFKIE